MDDAALTIRLCEYLARVPGWAWRPDGPYTQDETGLFYGQIAAAPDRAVGVRVYGGDDDIGLAERRVQVRFRGDPGVVDAADRMAGVAFVMLGALDRYRGVLGATRLSFLPLGADTNGREERTDNYLITLDNVEAI